MDNVVMIERLKTVGVEFSVGLTKDEISQIESTFGFRFPKEIAEFFSCAVPIGDGFFNYRDFSEENIRAFDDFQKNIKDMFLFDVENNTELICEMMDRSECDISNKEALATSVLSWFERSPRLIPFFSHRCFFAGMDGMPIVSFIQGVDTVFYGSDFENYLEHEFISPDEFDSDCFGEISGEIENTGIWYHVIK